MKKLLALLSLVLVLVIPMSSVFATIEETVNPVYIAKGTGSWYVTNNLITKTSAKADTAACVNLVYFSAPGKPSNAVENNDLVFRVRSSNGALATSVVNYRDKTASSDCRMYMYYNSGYGAIGASYKIACSLNDTSYSSYVTFRIRWNP